MLVHKIDPVNIINNLNTETFLDWEDKYSFDNLFKKPNLDLEEYKATDRKRYKPKNNIGKDLLGDKLTNIIVYPPYGGMGWHTNGPRPSKRMYASWSETGDSGMNWYDIDTDEVIIDKDNIGWNIRIFDIPSWHCVWTKCNRLSIGYNIS